MDEMLSMALWLMAGFMMVSAATNWFMTQSDFPSNLGLGIEKKDLIDVNSYNITECTMTALTDFPQYATCYVTKLTAPIFGLINGFWNLLTAWQNVFHVIFNVVPAGDLFELIFIPFLSIVEVGAIIVILMRLAAIVRGVAGGFL